MTVDLFDPETYAATRRPLGQAAPLPGWCYASAQWHEREIERIFRGPHSEWLCVGRTDQVPKPGDFYTIALAGQPLIVARDHDDRVNVLSAVCRHRGAVITEGEGRCRALVCPYHNWTYALDGRLINIPGQPPPMSGVEGFDAAAHGLKAMRTDIWAGFIFVTFNPHPGPLVDTLGGLPGFVSNYRLDEMRFTRRDVYDIDCNWKVWLENAFENYHVPTIHRRHIDPGKPQNWIFEQTDGPYEAMYSQRAIVAYSGLPTLAHLNEKEASGLFHLWLQPSLHLVLTSSYIRYLQYLPTGPETFTLIVNWAFHGSAIEQPEFANIVGPMYYDKYAEVFREDLRIACNVQRGMRSGAFEPGRYSLQEYIVHRIANYVLDRVVGPDSAPAQSGRQTPVAATA